MKEPDAMNSAARCRFASMHPLQGLVGAGRPLNHEAADKGRGAAA